MFDPKLNGDRRAVRSLRRAAVCMDAQNDFFVSGLEINLRWQRVMMAQANDDENKTTNLMNGIVGGAVLRAGNALDPVDPDPELEWKYMH